MNSSIKQEMARYPVFSCPQVVILDDFQVFKDQSMINQKRNLFAPHSYQKKRNQKIISIYNKIMNNNNKDPLYPKHSMTDSKNSQITIKTPSFKDKLQRGQRTVEKFVGELVTSLSQPKQDEDFDSHRHQQKVSLLKRIIEHYNIKNLNSDNYSNLIKTFGLKIQSANVDNIAIKKNLHPRKNIKLNPKTSHGIRSKPTYLRTLQPTSIGIYKNITNQITTVIEPQKCQECIIKIQQIKKQTPRQKSFTIQSRKFYKSQLTQKMRKSVQSSQKIIQRPFRRTIDSDCLENKVRKYRQFLYILNFSNRMFKQLDIDKYQQPFKYHVGKGNNGNMIKSLMKRRFWFQQTHNIQQANFIWTQLKLESVYGTQQEKQPIINLQIVRQSESISKIQRSPIKSSLARKGLKSDQQNDPILKLLTDDHYKQYNSIMDKLSIKNKPLFADRKKYHQKDIINKNQREKIHNHLPLNGYLGNKKAMFYSLREYYRLSDQKIFDIVPLTFHIRKGFHDQQFKAFMAVYLQRKKTRKNNIWIMKPGQFSNRGQGITCSSKIQDIRKRISKCRNSGKNQTLIIQSYISNPLLYNYRKFDIRAFMMITSHNGKIKGYWYQDGYIRTSSFTWRASQLEDSFIHLTNDAIQKNCQDYGKFEPGNKLSYTQLQRYLETLPANGRNMDFFGNIYPKLKSIASDAIKSTYLMMDPKRFQHNFQIFGMDFMIDDKMKPWLIQINTNPCLELSCPLLSRILPYMVQNALRISLDPLFPPPNNFSSIHKYNIPQNSLHYNKFQLIFDEDRDGPALVKLYENSKLAQEIDDVEQDKEEYVEEGTLLQLDDI